MHIATYVGKIEICVYSYTSPSPETSTGGSFGKNISGGSRGGSKAGSMEPPHCAMFEASLVNKEN